MKPRKSSKPAPYLRWDPAWGLCPLHPSHKRRYPTRGAAKAAARLMPRKAEVYRCATCGDFHLCRAVGLTAAIRYLEKSIADDRREAIRRASEPHVPA